MRVLDIGCVLAPIRAGSSGCPASTQLFMVGEELRTFSSQGGSVPQVLSLFNGPLSQMMLEEGSALHNNIKQTKTTKEGVRVVFLSVLNRPPDREELSMLVDEVEKQGAAGYGNVIWALINTHEFLFVQ